MVDDGNDCFTEFSYVSRSSACNDSTEKTLVMDFFFFIVSMSRIFRRWRTIIDYDSSYSGGTGGSAVKTLKDSRSVL